MVYGSPRSGRFEKNEGDFFRSDCAFRWAPSTKTLIVCGVYIYIHVYIYYMSRGLCYPVICIRIIYIYFINDEKSQDPGSWKEPIPNPGCRNLMGMSDIFCGFLGWILLLRYWTCGLGCPGNFQLQRMWIQRCWEILDPSGEGNDAWWGCTNGGGWVSIGEKTTAGDVNLRKFRYPSYFFSFCWEKWRWWLQDDWVFSKNCWVRWGHRPII